MNDFGCMLCFKVLSLHLHALISIAEIVTTQIGIAEDADIWD